MRKKSQFSKLHATGDAGAEEREDEYLCGRAQVAMQQQLRFSVENAAAILRILSAMQQA